MLSRDTFCYESKVPAFPAARGTLASVEFKY